MKNFAKEKPTDILAGRIKYTTEQFVDIKNIRNKCVLNIGCGFGWFENFALQNNVKQIVALEPLENDLSTIKKYINNKKLSCMVGSALELKFPDESFDTVCAWEVLEHVPKGTENVMFNEIKRVLKKEGIFYMSTPYNNIISKLLDPAWYIIGHRHYSFEQLKQYTAEVGFQVDKYDQRGGWWELIFMLNLYVAKWVFKQPPFYRTFFRRMLDNEYAKDKGFSNVFLKCIKK